MFTNNARVASRCLIQWGRNRWLTEFSGANNRPGIPGGPEAFL